MKIEYIKNKELKKKNTIGEFIKTELQLLDKMINYKSKIISENPDFLWLHNNRSPKNMFRIIPN